VRPFSFFAHRLGTKILGVMAVASLLSVPVTAPAQPKASPSPVPPQAATTGHPTAAEGEEWRKALMAIPRPTNGCFTATYPERKWRNVTCTPPTPHKLYPPQQGGMSRIDIVGGAGPDFSAVVTGHISEAEGSFDNVTGVTSTNSYSLQLNTAPFQTSTCAGSPGGIGGGCQGWEQFVYESSGSSFIQYWLLTYGPAGTLCPTPRHVGCAANSSYNDGWCPFQFTSTGPVYCVVNAVNQPPTSPEPMTSLGQLKVTGTAASGVSNDAISITVGGNPLMATGNNYFPDLGNRWQEVEFNAFGNGSSSQAVFNSRSTAVVRTAVTSGTTAGPSCHIKSWTGESNNLTLVNSPPTASPGSAPALVFSESNPAPGGAMATCADALSLGDTHLTTFGRLLYDFQATGDFLAAETGPDFLVQTRQVSGAPTWPNASVNKAVAVQTGKDRVAICLPGRVVVDGKSATIRDGGRLGLSNGGNVIRKANMYYVLAPSGDSIRATVNSTYIDLSVGLGRWPSNVRGLLANANGKVNEIEAQDGAVLTSPFCFEKLYGHYADSWRVPPNQSMLNACGESIQRGIPKKPFFANDLDPKLARRNRAICTEAGVKEGPLLDACMIDVAMIGPGAAKVFARTPMPAAVGDERDSKCR
jgi:hypothetical protein